MPLCGLLPGDTRSTWDSRLAEYLPKPGFRIEPLGSQHDRAAFSCGVEALDTYLQRYASQDQRRRVAVAFILTPDSVTVAGYYTLSQSSIELDVIPVDFAKKLPRYSRVPATLIGRLAVSTSFRGQKLGALLLMDALHRCLMGSKQFGSAAVLVDAKDDAALSFYKKYGFLELPGIGRRLLIPMDAVEKLFM